MRGTFYFILNTSLFFILITLIWQTYERYKYGEIRPDMFDSLIAVALSISLTCNVHLFDEIKKG